MPGAGPTLEFERFLPHEELCAQVGALADWLPEWTRMEGIGESPEGREILLLTVTAPGPGPEDKPGYLIHANIHAGELSGSACALYMAHYLLTHRDEPALRTLLERVAFYIIPRVCPDGAEEVLVEQTFVRSRLTAERRKNCVWPEDINGDGCVHRMRVPDPNGHWAAPADEPRLLFEWRPEDEGGQRYRLTTEGTIHDWDGGPWEDPATTRFDFNRNWAAEWRPQHVQSGAGRYPFSEPEVRAVADYILDHENLFGVFGLHCGTNAILRPPTSTGDNAIAGPDLLMFRRLAQLGSRITGFPAKAIHEYRNDLAAPIELYGTFTEWGYRHCGLFAMEIELGNLYNSVGYDTERVFRLTPDEERQRERDCLAWHDAHPEAGVFAEWQRVEHPQLGPVEVGGITPAGLYNAVPGERLGIWEKTRQLLCELAGRGPELVLTEPQVEELANGLYRITCRVANEGRLPTNVTAIGAGMPHRGGVCVEVDREGEVGFVANRSRVELGHLGAASYEELTWVLRAAPGARITINAHAPAAGRCSANVVFED